MCMKIIDLLRILNWVSSSCRIEDRVKSYPGLFPFKIGSRRLHSDDICQNKLQIPDSADGYYKIVRICHI